MTPSRVRNELAPMARAPLAPRGTEVRDPGRPAADDPYAPDNLGAWDTFEARPEPVCDWTPIALGMPPDGVPVDTLTSGGRGVRLKWEGRLWRLPGGAHYPCYTPDYWRLATG
jgi:hypothetical protein